MANEMATARVDAIAGFLEGVGVPFELIEHDTVMSAGAEAQVAEESPEKVAKTVVLHDGSACAVAAISAADSVLVDPRDVVRITAAKVADISED